MANSKHKKQAAKGQKKILEENLATLSFYRNLTIGVNVAYLLFIFVWLQLFTFGYIAAFVLCVMLYVACYQLMLYMANIKSKQTTGIFDFGIDLNMEGGITEHVKDLIILTAGCQLFSLYSNYCWFLWILAPVRLFWLCWINFLGPYFFQPASVNPLGISERRQKRMDRRLKRS